MNIYSLRIETSGDNYDKKEIIRLSIQDIETKEIIFLNTYNTDSKIVFNQDKHEINEKDISNLSKFEDSIKDIEKIKDILYNNTIIVFNHNFILDILNSYEINCTTVDFIDLYQVFKNIEYVPIENDNHSISYNAKILSDFDLTESYGKDRINDITNIYNIFKDRLNLNQLRALSQKVNIKQYDKFFKYYKKIDNKINIDKYILEPFFNKGNLKSSPSSNRIGIFYKFIEENLEELEELFPKYEKEISMILNKIQFNSTIELPDLNIILYALEHNQKIVDGKLKETEEEELDFESMLFL